MVLRTAQDRKPHLRRYLHPQPWLFQTEDPKSHDSGPSCYCGQALMVFKLLQRVQPNFVVKIVTLFGYDSAWTCLTQERPLPAGIRSDHVLQISQASIRKKRKFCRGPMLKRVRSFLPETKRHVAEGLPVPEGVPVSFLVPQPATWPYDS